MPILHCHLPPDEDDNKKLPGDEEPQIPDPNDMNESENSNEPEPITADTEDEETEDANGTEASNEESEEVMDESSDEAPSLVNDPSIVYPWVPDLNTSDEEGNSNHDQQSITDDDENEPMEFSTTVGHVRSYPARNVARRSRGRCPGVNFVRRGRHRQPIMYDITTTYYYRVF